MVSFLNSIETEHGIKFLVVDRVVDRLLECLFAERSELLKYVTAVDIIDSETRSGQASVDVVYMVSPTRYNINCIDADFSNVPPKYRRHHIRFLPGLDQGLAQYLHSRRNLSQFMVSLAEIKCGFYPREQQYFETIGIDQPLQVFFNAQCTDLIERNIRRTVHSLLNICIVTGEYPIVRYSEPNPEVSALSRPTLLAKKLAVEFQYELDNYARQHEDFPPANSRPRSIFIIASRALDLFSPLVHDFTYQSMAYDLVNEVNMTTDVFSYEAENEMGEREQKTSKLADLVDPDWLELKHQHIADASEYLNSKINEMIAKNPLLVDRSKVKTTTDLLSVVAHLKDFDEERRRITVHKTLIDQCLETSKQRNLVEASEVEQALCSFGLDIDGNKVKNFTDEFVNMLASTNASTTDKVRYIIEYALFRGGLIEPDLVKLLAFIGIEPNHKFYKHFMQLFKNFDFMGFQLIKPHVKDPPFKKEWAHSTLTNDPNIYQTSRFVPAVGNALSSVITNPLLLSEDSFPYVKDKPIELLDPGLQSSLQATTSVASLKNPRHKAAWAKTNSQSKIPKQRFFYYILGGITHVELKAASTQSHMKNKDVFIGSDSILTPLQFMQGVEKLSESRDHLRLKDDSTEPVEPPSFLFRRAPKSSPVNQPQRHHLPEQPRPQTSAVCSAPTPLEDAKEKDKRRHKFTKFLRK